MKAVSFFSTFFALAVIFSTNSFAVPNCYLLESRLVSGSLQGETVAPGFQCKCGSDGFVLTCGKNHKSIYSDHGRFCVIRNMAKDCRKAPRKAVLTPVRKPVTKMRPASIKMPKLLRRE